MVEHTYPQLARLNSWNANWQQVSVAVIGLGAAGFSVVDTLAELGARVLVVDMQPDAQLTQLVQVVGAQSACGEIAVLRAAIADFAPQLVIEVDAKLATQLAVHSWAADAKIPVLTDTDLAWLLRDKQTRPAKWLTVAGVNGKQRTAELAAYMLLAAGNSVAPVSKRQVPVLDALRDPTEYDFYVVSLSDLDLQNTSLIKPEASALLNANPEQAAALGRVYANTRVACVYNRHDAHTLSQLENADVQEGARAVSVGLDTPPVAGLGFVEDIAADRGFHADRRSSGLELFTIAELQQKRITEPEHIIQVLTAAALARAIGVTPEQILSALLSLPEAL